MFYLLLILLLGVAGLLFTYCGGLTALDNYLKRKAIERAKRAYELFATAPHEANRLAQRARKRLQHRRIVPDPDVRRSLALACFVLAIVAHRNQQPQIAKENVEVLRSVVKDVPQGDQLLLKYYVLAEDTSAGAVESYLRHLKKKTVEQRQTPDVQKVIGLLRKACTPTSERPAAQLPALLKWNQYAQQLFAEEDWPILNQAEVLLLQKQLEPARALFARHLENRPDCQLARLGLARAQMALAKPEEARDNLGIVARVSTDPDAILEAARNLALLGELPLADEAIHRVETLAPHLLPRCLALSGRIRLHTGQVGEAVALLQQSAALAPNDVPTLLALAEALSRQGDQQQAAECARRAVPISSTDPRQQFALGSALCNAGKFLEAAACFERCRKAGYDYQRSALLHARCSLRGNAPQAAATALHIPKLDGNNPEIPFYRGVAYFRSNAPREAVPHFAKVYNLAKAAGNQELLRQAKSNICACYFQTGSEQIREGKFAEAPQSFEVLRRNFTPTQPEHALIGRIIAECYLRCALRTYQQGGDRSLPQVILALEKGAAYELAQNARFLLGALYLRQNRPDEAAGVFEGIHRQAPGNEAIAYALALAQSRGTARPVGVEALREHVKQGTSQAIRAALTLAALEVEQGQYGAAVGVLSGGLNHPKAQRDPWYIDACSQAVLNAFRTGNEAWAIRLAEGYFAKASGGSPSLLLGCLLADAGEYPRALTHLEKALSGAQRSPLAERALTQVARQVAWQYCKQGDFPAAEDVVAGALGCVDDAELGQLNKLLGAIRSGAECQALDDQTLGLLEEIHAGVGRPGAGLVRSLLVAHHRRAYTLASLGEHFQSRRHWETAHTLWHNEVQLGDSFWSDYLAAYSAGKQYQVTASASDLEQALQRRLSGVCVHLVGQALEARSLPDAQFYWQEATTLSTLEQCRELFKEVVSLDAIIAALEPAQNRKLFAAVVRFLYEEVEPREDFGGALRELALERALKALVEDRGDEFLEALDEASRFDPTMQAMAQRIKRMGSSLAYIVLLAFQTCVRSFAAQTPGAGPFLEKLLLGILDGFAKEHQRSPGSLTVQRIGGLMPRLLQEQLKVMEQR